jgi:hypothetical protein
LSAFTSSSGPAKGAGTLGAAVTGAGAGEAAGPTGSVGVWALLIWGPASVATIKTSVTVRMLRDLTILLTAARSEDACGQSSMD